MSTPPARKRRHWADKLTKANALYIKELKESTPCADCKQSYPSCVMDFDHVRGRKKIAIGTAVRKWDLNQIKSEILKCEIVCSNCHRIRTHITRKKKR